MINMSLAEISNILGCTPLLLPDSPFTGISIDTRTLSPGNLFIAIQGEKFDAHLFLDSAKAKGAIAAVVERKIDSTLPQIIVPNTQLALGKIADYWRQQFSLPLIGVTGSNGKTTLKNMIASILRAACHQDASQVLATAGNFNNEIGLPLNLIKLNEKHRYAVLEMGMNHFGEIAYLTQLAKPIVAVITNAAESHLEGVHSVAGVAKAKGEIFQGLAKNGTAILNQDDAYFNYWRELIGNRACLTFGLTRSADVTATRMDGQRIHLQTPQGTQEITLPLLGKHNVMNALAATAATLAIGIDLVTIKEGLEQVEPAPHRMRPHQLKNGACIIDDTYNANPFSLQAAVDTLATFSGTKIVVLGDMRELGPDAKHLHFSAGENMVAAGIDYLFTLGELSAATTESFGKNAQHFTERTALLAALQPHVTANTTILIKGSRSMQMETILYGMSSEIPHNNTH